MNAPSSLILLDIRWVYCPPKSTMSTLLSLELKLVPSIERAGSPFKKESSHLPHPSK
ncbi:MAG: hypothetical protein ACP5LZ_07330 [Fervidicoccaceae archaeon]